MATFEGVTQPLKFGRKIRCLSWEDKTRFMFLLKGSAIRDAVHHECGEPDTEPKHVNNILIEHREGQFYPAQVTHEMFNQTDWAVVPLPPTNRK